MSRRLWFTILALLVVASMLLSACARQTATPTQAPPAVTEPSGVEETAPPAVEAGPYEDVDPTGQEVVFWHQHTRDREEGLNELIAEFNATNEWGITVIPEYQGGYGDIFNKMLGVLNTPDAPNIVVAYQNQAATYQLADAMVDMNPLVESEKWGLSEEEQADFFEGFFMQDVFPTYGDARLGFPPNRSMEVLYYNIDWLEELGYDGPPETPEEFREMACAATENPFSGATAEGSIGYELSIDASRFASWTFAFGGDVFDYNTSQYTYNSEAAQEAMAFLQGLFDDGCATIVVEAFGDQTDFGAGTTLFTVGSSSGLPFYRSAVEAGANHQWSVGAIPHTTPDPVMNIYGASVSIPKTTPEEELAAWLFIKYYTSPDAQAEWTRISQYFPVRASVADELDDVFAEDPAFEAAFEMLQYGKFEPPVPGYDFVRDIVENEMAAIADGAPVEETLNSLDETANEILSEQLTSPLPTPVPTSPPEPTAAPVTVGTEDNPIQVLFVPSVDNTEIVAGGEALAEVLNERTGYHFEVAVPTSYAATIEEMCASPENTMGFIPGLGYVLANQLCGVDVAAKAVRFGYDWYAAMVVVARDSDIESVEDLEGLTWAYPDPGSTSGYLYPLFMFQEAGVTPGETLEAGSHDGAIRAVYQGEADFGTAFFSPPRVDGTSIDWEPGEDPDVPADLLDSCDVTADGGTVMCGNFEPRDARRNIRSEAPDVMQEVRVLATTPKIPNDTISFGPEFPEEVRQAIMDALFAFAEEDPDAFGEAMAPYSWSSVIEATDAEYDPIRLAVQAAGFEMEDLGE